MANPAESQHPENRIDDTPEMYRFGTRIPMLCECGTDCESLVMIGVEAYRHVRRDPELFLAAPGHEVGAADLEYTTSNYAIFRSRARTESQAA